MEQAPRYAVYVYGRLKVAADTHQGLRPQGAGRDQQAGRRAQGLHRPLHPAQRLHGADRRRQRRVRAQDDDGTPKQTVQVVQGGLRLRPDRLGKPDSAYYSIRFGPGMKYHGHEDHLGVTYYAQGRDILVDGGFHSYEKSAYRYWTLSPEAHNVPVRRGSAFRPRTSSKLVKSKYGRTGRRSG